MKIQKKSEKGMGERGWGRKKEGEDWQKADGVSHLACALGPATWGSGPGLCLNDSFTAVSFRLTSSRLRLSFGSTSRWCLDFRKFHIWSAVFRRRHCSLHHLRPITALRIGMRGSRCV